MSYLVVAAVLPVILLCLFIYKKDVNKEPSSLLWKIFVLGFFSAIPIVGIELLLSMFFNTDTETSFILLFINTFISVALIEEGFKWLITRLMGYNNKDFDEIYDIIVYAVFASLGFACIENILFVCTHGLGNAILRALLSIPGHTCFGVIMGYFLSQAKVGSVNGNKSISTKNMWLSIIMPTLAHTMYDTLIFYTVNSGRYIFLLVFLILDIVMVVLCFKTVNKMSKIQVRINKNLQTGVIVINRESLMVPQDDTTFEEANYCPICGKPVKGFDYCPYCGFKLK